MKPLTAEISEDMLKSLSKVIDNNLGWNKTLVVRALLNYFLQLEPDKQEKLLKEYQVKIVEK